MAQGGLWTDVAKRLAPTSDTPGLDAQVLLAALTGRSQAWILAHPELRLDPHQAAALDAALGRLTAGEPLPYVTGQQAFYGLDFAVTPAVLIPRPETELLVEQALAWLQAHPHRRLAVDVGTGSGCISAALAARTPGLQVLATDLSLAALRIAQVNLRRHGLQGQVQLVQADLIAPVKGPVDLIAANLPYIPTGTLAGLAIFGREPSLALDGGPDGLAVIRRLLEQAQSSLAPGGLLLLEIEATQGETAVQAARQAFSEAQISLHLDLAGNPRLVRVERG